VKRLNIELDDEHAEKLARLAERTHIEPGTLARSLLSIALCLDARRLRRGRPSR
jgi:predicted transcriptional regulator